MTDQREQIAQMDDLIARVQSAIESPDKPNIITMHVDDVKALLKCAAMGEPQGVVKPLEFDWKRDENSPNPTCHRVIGNGYSAYVLIPYEDDFDPTNGVGSWNGVAQNRGESGFETKEDAVAYCERTIREFAQVSINCASNFLQVAPAETSVSQAAQVLLELLATSSENSNLPKDTIEAIWQATFRESGFSAVSSFLHALAAQDAGAV